MSKMWKLWESCSDVAHVVSLALITGCCSQWLRGNCVRVSNMHDPMQSALAWSSQKRGMTQRKPPDLLLRGFYLICVMCKRSSPELAVEGMNVNWSSLTLVCLYSLLEFIDARRDCWADRMHKCMGGGPLSSYKLPVIRESKTSQKLPTFHFPQQRVSKPGIKSYDNEVLYLEAGSVLLVLTLGSVSYQPNTAAQGGGKLHAEKLLVNLK